MDKMGLIVFAKTGHVLGAFTRTIDPESKLAPRTVAAPALLVRDPATGEEMAHVEPQHLGVEIVDRRDDVLLLHRQFVVADGIPAEKDPLAFSTAITYASPTLTVTPDAAPAEDVEAWVQLEDGVSQPILVPVEILAAASTGEATVTLTAGTDYKVLALVPGHAAVVGTLTV